MTAPGPQLYGPLDGILTTTLSKWLEKNFVDNVFKARVLFYMLSKADNIRKIDGGESITVPVMEGDNGTVMTYSQDEELKILRQKGFTGARYNWAQSAVSITITGIEEAKNRGESRIIGLLEAKTEQAEESFAASFNRVVRQGCGRRQSVGHGHVGHVERTQRLPRRHGHHRGRDRGPRLCSHAGCQHAGRLHSQPDGHRWATWATYPTDVPPAGDARRPTPASGPARQGSGCRSTRAWPHPRRATRVPSTSWLASARCGRSTTPCPSARTSRRSSSPRRAPTSSTRTAWSIRSATRPRTWRTPGSRTSCSRRARSPTTRTPRVRPCKPITTWTLNLRYLRVVGAPTRGSRTPRSCGPTTVTPARHRSSATASS